MSITPIYNISNHQIGFQSGRAFASPVKRQAKAAVYEAMDFAAKLTEYKSADGKPILTKNEAEKLVKNCRVIPNYQAKIEAVLKNPQEVAVIMQNKNRGYGVWNAIHEPLYSL